MATLAEQIRSLVLLGDLRPGERLEEQVLADRFEVSRTPVREALRQLASTGLIELRPNRGAFVTELTPSQLDEMFVAMVELEATCARLAAMSMVPSERRNLQRLHESMGQIASSKLVEDFEVANEQLHAMICSGAHNSVLADMTASIRDRRRPYRGVQFRSPGRLLHSHAEHETLVRAIVAGDPAQAHAAMLHHLDRASQSYGKARLGNEP